VSSATLLRGFARMSSAEAARDARAPPHQEREIRALKDKLASGQGRSGLRCHRRVRQPRSSPRASMGPTAARCASAVDQLKSRLGSAIMRAGGGGIAHQGAAGRRRHARSGRAIKAGELVGAVAAQVGARRRPA